MVTFVSFLVAIFGAGLHARRPGLSRGSSPRSRCSCSRCACWCWPANFLLLFVFWEAVGLCSYLLIGFWFQKPSAAAAAKKAFVVNRIGDFGFLLGIFLIWTTFGSLEFRRRARRSGRDRASRRGRSGRDHADLPAAVPRGDGQERPVPAARLVAGRDGRPDAGQRADPRGDDGHGRRLPGRPLHAAVRARARRRSWSSPASARRRRCSPR